jgi:flagellar biosynthesis/type III secretory pathway protein FliH
LSAWVTLFEHWQEEDSMSHITDTDTRRAYDKLKSLSADDEARRLAFVRERALHDEAQLLLEAREEGLEKGREEGRAEGREAGRGSAQRQIAINMIRQTSLDDAGISAITGLSPEEIAALRRQR